MFRRPSTWFVISLLCLGGSYYCWKLGDRWAAEKRAARHANTGPAKRSAAIAITNTVSAATAPFAFVTQPAAAKSGPISPIDLRLSNTTKNAGELLRNGHALILENALLDTAAPINLDIPAHLRSSGDPGSYLVQSRRPVDDAFRAQLKQAGAEIISYIPNNAFLVRASAAVAQQLAGVAQTVAPFEPYYKLKDSLLVAAVKQEPLPQGLGLNVVLFADAAAATREELQKLGATVSAEERTPFGPMVHVQPPANWYTVATLPGVQSVELWSPRFSANDRSRVALGVSVDTIGTSNYLDLYGSNVIVAVVDSGVDATHPDFLNNRVTGDSANSLQDFSGHGTHVAGIIAGNGQQSTNPTPVGKILQTNDFGSLEGADFRGKAPGAALYSIQLARTDAELQQAAAGTNALISNNSWNYSQSTYTISAASYDAAVRDALPGVPGAQPVLFVFSAGNSGGGGDNGLSGRANSIQAPATAKNVIAVGALEQLRNITNEVVKIEGGATNRSNPWKAATSSDSEVASYSSRGNVGVGVEGDSGRYKPDVVAPGTFVVSTRSAQWDEKAYYNPTNHHTLTSPDQFVVGTNLVYYFVFVPPNAVGLNFTLFARNGVDFPIYVWAGTASDAVAPSFVTTNRVTAPPDGGPNFGPVNTTWTFAVGNPPNATPDETHGYEVFRDLITTNDLGNYYEVLSNLNNTISGDPDSAVPPHYYRFESGTSMAAADVSGTLALMQDFFARFGRTNSPALMKALLINGARTVGDYDFKIDPAINFQGWGMPFLPAILPGELTNFLTGASSYAMWFQDQNPTNALATGQSTSRHLKINNLGGQNQPLRITLVWTDPPGNPTAGVKLVNDLDLIVTNRDTGDVYFGNDFVAGAFVDPWDTNNAPRIDSVNNVENIYIGGSLGSNYDIVVSARTVNVNAVTTHPNGTVQDYALVISSGEGDIEGALTIDPPVQASLPALRIDYPTNSFSQAEAAGFILEGQRVGANTPLLGTTNGMSNQWHFYVVTNTTSFTNAAFVTFLPVNLALPRLGVWEDSITNATRLSADIDLYVSADPDLTNLTDVAVAGARKSIGRSGTEQIVVSNAVPGRLYYIGVKSEDQMAAEYSLFAVFSLNPFDGANGELSCFGFPTAIPDRTPDGVVGAGNSANIICPCIADGEVHRVIVTNVISHEYLPDVFAVVNHGVSSGAQLPVVVENHRSAPADPPAPGPYGFIYEDNGEGDLPLNQTLNGIPYYLLPSGGPQNLRSYVGEPRTGPWIFTFLDNSLSQTGFVANVRMTVEKEDLTTNGPLRSIQPGGWIFAAINVPFDATNLTVCLAGSTGFTAPLELYLRRGEFPTRADYDKFGTISPPGGCISLTPFDDPPLDVPARYYIGVFNPNATVQTVRIIASVDRNISTVVSTLSASTGPLPIQDDAVTYATFDVTNHLSISDLNVGLLIKHSRISDLVLTLISPKGTRILLYEERGLTTTNGLGTISSLTNGIGSFGLEQTNVIAYFTNNFDDVLTGPYSPGAIFDGWNVLTNQVFVLPDYSEPSLDNNSLILANGVVSNALPTTNSTSYELSFRVTHAPYLVGTVGWWPFDGDGLDRFGGHDGLLCCNVAFDPGKVNGALYGDGVAARVLVPRSPDLDVGKGYGFSIEGWIRPLNVANPEPLVEWFDATNVIPTGVQLWLSGGFTNGSGAGSISAALWDTNGSPNFLETVPLAITNGDPGFFTNGVATDLTNGWQHVALTYDAATKTTRIYTNGHKAAELAMPRISRILTTGDLNFGYHPPGAAGYFPTNKFRPAAAVQLQQPTATFSESFNGDYSIARAIDGTTADDLGWAISASGGPPGSSQTAVFETVSNIGFAGGSILTFNLVQTHSNPGHTLGHFRISVTTDDRSTFADGLQTGGDVTAAWIPLDLSTLVTANGTILTRQADKSVLASGVTPATDTYTISARTLLRGITGIRLEALTDPSLPFGGPGRWPGNGNFVLSEFSVSVAPLPVLPTFLGGMDEFGLYDRALSDCEIASIVAVGTHGKYSSNVLTCPVAMQLTLSNAVNVITTVFTNGLTWTNNGPHWEVNRTNFADLPVYPVVGAPATNYTAIFLRPLDPNVAVDDFVVSALLTNFVDGLVHFTEDTNLAAGPVKFAAVPFVVSNFPPVLLFTNDFENVTQQVFQVGDVLIGSTNNLAVQQRDWTVTGGPIMVLSNAAFGYVQTNWVALAGGSLQTTLPTLPGHRYELAYTLRGPSAVGLWSGDQEPLSRRAQDSINGNHGAFVNLATNRPGGYVVQNNNDSALFLPGMLNFTNGIASKIELGDPPQLRLTNAITIEGWVRPEAQTNVDILAELPFSEELVVEQILFRGDSRNCRDPYWLALEQEGNNQWQILFHIEGPNSPTCGITVETEGVPIFGGWHHIAATFERNANWTNNAPWPTNQIRIYLDGVEETNLVLEPFEDKLFDGFTAENPFQDLDPAFSPGVTIGNRSRGDASQPFRGWLDELTVYDRALTAPEIQSIFQADRVGKSDPSVAPAQSLAKLRVRLQGQEVDVGHGDNGQWGTHRVDFTAHEADTVLSLESLAPGTLIDSIALTELPAELNYLPEETLAALRGEDAFGTWKLEILDVRAGANTDNPTLVQWQLDFRLAPSNPPPVITLEHGLPYTNTLSPNSVQYFLVRVPQWATQATNILQFAREYVSGQVSAVGVLYSQTNFPTNLLNALAWPPVTTATNILTTNSIPPLGIGQTYFLAVTNPQPVAVTFAVGVSYDVTTLVNCLPTTNFVRTAGIPRYFQFDVPTNDVSPQVMRDLSFWLTGAGSNLTVVLSQHLPLPDLAHYDYISQRPATNDEVFLVVTNTTPFPLQTNRWYIGVFNTAATNVPFTVEACASTNFPALIPLTNDLAYSETIFDPFAAPPGPPRSFFFDFHITNNVDAVLFETYGLTGDLDLVLQRNELPGMAPYFDGSYRLGNSPEQIVVRRSFEIPDLRGHWYLGLHNNETNLQPYTIRASLPVNGRLLSAQPLVLTLSPQPPPVGGLLLQWNSIAGETYFVRYANKITSPINWTVIASVTATTSCATYWIPILPSGIAFYSIEQTFNAAKPPLVLKIQIEPGGVVRISWPFEYAGFRLQSAPTVIGPWTDVPGTPIVEGNENVLYLPAGSGSLFFRLIQ